MRLTEGCRYTYPDKKKQFSVPDGRTIIGQGAVPAGHTDLYPVLTSSTSGSRITLQDVMLTGPSLCVLVPAYSHFTLKNVKLHCTQSMATMRVKDEGTADLIDDTELRGGGPPHGARRWRRTRAWRHRTPARPGQDHQLCRADPDGRRRCRWRREDRQPEDRGNS
ncbi:hypothetical protein JGS39_17055 [Streptomyces sp. P01-B04]|uniref:hypothetical protein n=1 Tax=Streptomyces poriferorum TaxID=2798799 RepID=UPI001C5CEB7F|nr:hypothetical protein [Streptomyces poriferorum]MBW5250678.1 hypothetical protein [Streptomyces poriferorum]MBW5259449.1 hypothetical protein [Streptomyces poriferorum]